MVEERMNENRVTMSTGDFILFSNRTEFNPGKTYVVQILEFIGEENAKLIRKNAQIKVKETYKLNSLDVVITDDGRRGFIQKLGSLKDQGPEVYDFESSSEYYDDEIEDQDSDTDEYDFIIYAGRKVRPGDYCLSMKPSTSEKIATKLKEVFGKRSLQVFYLLRPGMQEDGASIVKGFTIDRVYKLGKNQLIETTDGRIGINLLRAKQ